MDNIEITNENNKITESNPLVIIKEDTEEEVKIRQKKKLQLASGNYKIYNDKYNFRKHGRLLIVDNESYYKIMLKQRKSQIITGIFLILIGLFTVIQKQYLIAILIFLFAILIIVKVSRSYRIIIKKEKNKDKN